MMTRLRLTAFGVLVVVTSRAADPPKPDPHRETLSQSGKIPALVVSGNDPFHRWKETTPQFRTVLEGSGRFEVRLVEDVYILESRAALARYRVIIFNQQVATSTPKMRENLTNYVRGGGGLLAFHWAVDNFHDWPGFVDVLGRVWKEGSSGEEHGSFAVTVKDRDHPITRNFDAYRTPAKEAVHYDLAGAEPVRDLLTARLPVANRDVSILFVHQPGKGRVAFTPLGHSTTSRECPGFERLLCRAAEWCATGEVSEK